jgi:hypothetical protein
MTHPVTVLFTDSRFEAAGAPGRSYTKFIRLGWSLSQIRNIPRSGGVYLRENTDFTERLITLKDFTNIREGKKVKNCIYIFY